MPKRKNVAASSLCKIANDPQVRAVSATQTDAIKDSFPVGVARPALRALLSAGYTSLEQLTAISEQEIAQLHGMGPHAIEKLRKGLEEQGLRFLKAS